MFSSLGDGFEDPSLDLARYRFGPGIGATLQGIPLEQAAAEHEELHIALEEWVDPFKGLEM